MQVKKQQLELCMEQLICSKLGKEYDRAVYHHLAYLTYIMQHTRLDESQAEIKIAWKNNNNFKYVDDTTLMAESEEELKSLLMRVRRKVEKAGLKLNIHKSKIMASSPITSWQIERGKVEAVTNFIFLVCKITVASDYSHETKRRLLFGRKAMTKLDRVLKSRDVTLITKVHIVRTMVFPAVMYRCESWTVKKAER